jgi:cobalamin biosynthetic protein CobC
VLAPAALRRALAERLGPWAVNGPARHVARAALADAAWQAGMRARLTQEGARLATLLRAAGLGEPAGPALFQWFAHPAAAMLHERLARSGILVRAFDAPPGLRLGLPPDEAGWQRLEHALAALPRAAGA